MEIVFGILAGIITSLGMGGGAILILFLTIFLNIDQHRPFTSPRVQEILELVEPEFVCHEISAKNRADKLEKVLVQMKALGRI